VGSARRALFTVDSGINARLAQLDDPASEMTLIWNREHDQYVLRQLLMLAEPHTCHLESVLPRGA
jgi:hypothetical protein